MLRTHKGETTSNRTTAMCREHTVAVHERSWVIHVKPRSCIAGAGITDHDVVGCSLGWYAVRMPLLCSCGHGAYSRNHSAPSNRSWHQVRWPKVRGDMPSATQSVGVQVVLLCLAACGFLT